MNTEEIIKELTKLAKAERMLGRARKYETLARAAARLQELAETVAGYDDVFDWATGKVGDFPPRKEGEGAYWWRTELATRVQIARQRAASLSPTGGPAARTSTKENK